MTFARLLAGTMLVCALAGCQRAEVPAGQSEPAEWRHFGGEATGQRFSSLTDISAENVDQLKVAWTFNTGDFSDGGVDTPSTAFSVSPLVIGEDMFLCTPNGDLLALDPETGKQKWRYTPNPKVNSAGVYSSVCRGVGYFEDEAAEADSACKFRLFSGTIDGRLLAVDARTGKACDDFGNAGAVDLKVGLGEVEPGEYYMTSAPLVAQGLVVTGAFVKDVQRLDAPSGAVRAFDARTGELRWVWDPVPPGMKPVTADEVKAGAVLTRGTPNTWGPMSTDPEGRTIFLGTGNPSPDHYAGVERGEMDHYGSAIVALDSATGAVKWRFQTVHRDLWDYDVAAQPVYYRMRGQTGERAVVAAPTKLGFIFILDAETGEPVFPVEERSVPRSKVPGLEASPTQPFPTRPEPIMPLELTSDSIWGLTPIDRARCRDAFEALDYEGPFTPPSERGAIQYPGLGGGINWGSVSIDPVQRRMVANVQMAPFTIKLVPRAAAGDKASGSDLTAFGPQTGTPYAVQRGPLLSPWGTPCVPPPWGQLAAFDIDTGELLWKQPFGTLHNNPKAPLVGRFFNWGTPNTGGSLQTGSGLIFIGATMDGYFRAIDSQTGKEVWRYALPFAAQSTPISYKLKKNGRQFIVVAAGGHAALGIPTGDALVAFALPER